MAANLTFYDDYVVVDIETTGFSPQTEMITEIAALRVRGGRIVDAFSMLVNPERELDLHIVRITGITDEMLADAPLIDAVLPQFLDFVQDDVILGHCIQFDLGFLAYQAKRFGLAFNPLSANLLPVARQALPFLPNHKLGTIASYLEVAPATHRALADCYATQASYEICKGMLKVSAS